MMMIASASAFLDLALRSTLLLALAWSVAGMMRLAGASAAARHQVWMSVMAGLLLLPLASSLLPPLHLAFLPVADPPATRAVVAGAGGGSENALLGLGACLYLLPTAVLLVRLVFGQWLLSRLWRSAAPAAGWDSLLHQAAKSLGVHRRVELRIDRGGAGPMTWGIFRSRILLPADAASWLPERRRLVLLHELAHVARRDSLWRLAAALACACYWFHPAVWQAARRLRLEQELACDDRALLAGAGTRDYAGVLLNSVKRAVPAPGQLASAMARPSQLEMRLRAIVTDRTRRAPRRGFAAAVALTALGATMLIAAAAPMPAPPHAAEAPSAPEAPAARPTPPAPAAGLPAPPPAPPAPPRRTALLARHVAPPPPPAVPRAAPRAAPLPPPPASAPLPPPRRFSMLPPTPPVAPSPPEPAAPPRNAAPPAPPIPPAPPS